MSSVRFGRWAAPLILLALAISSTGYADEAAQREHFEKHIRPVLVQHCYQCHSVLAKEVKGSLRLDTREAIRKGGESGPAVVPGKVAESLLISALRHETVAMPPDKKLPDSTIAHFVHWIETGAFDSRDEGATPDLQFAAARAAQFEQFRQWWSLQPVVEPAIPEVKNAAWSGQPIDRFLLSKLEASGLGPVPRASREVLIRRLSFALTGLPPTPAEVEAFVKDDSSDAWKNLVERLLASPHFGETWARHWMDVVRYTDTYGYEWDMPAKGSWRYRDYLTRAFNQDIPFNQLIREQIAGDLLENPRIDPQEQINESLIGPMFYQMGEKRHGDSAEFDGIHQEMMDNKVDAFSKAFQAQTVACARCHDHKLDPILQSEYYALGGVFMSSRWVTRTLDTPQRNANTFAELKTIKANLRKELAARWLADVAELPKVMLPTAAPPESITPKQKVWQEVLTPETKEPVFEDLRHTWWHASRVIDKPGETAVVWKNVDARIHEHSNARIDQFKANFTVAADFSKEVPAGWSVDGVGLREPVRSGDFVVALEGPSAVTRLLPAGLFTNSLSPRMNGVIRTPLLNTFDKSFISFEFVGGDFSAHRTVIDNAFLTEKQAYLQQPSLGWLTLSTYRAMPQRRIFLELATKTSNPNFPPRVGLGGACSEEQVADPRSWLGVSRVILHEQPALPMDQLQRYFSLFEGEAPQDMAGVAAAFARWFSAALRRWEQDQATDDDVRLINWLLDNGQITNQHEVAQQPAIAALVSQYRTTEAKLLTPQTVNGMADIDAGINLPLNKRGEYDQPGDIVPRGYLSIMGAAKSGFTSPHSGRRELAEIIADPKNPLTARVFVNRVWQWLYGTGIVATSNDFGHVGAEPSHPELLDYLAARFMAEGWSVKKLVREIVLTQAWQQTSTADENALTIDPANRLLHHYPLRRLEAEALRDSVLAVSGGLDPTLYGPPINPHRHNEDGQKRLFSGPVDGNGRRSIYTKLSIMEPPRILAVFNQPPPKIPTGRRDVTNTPSQALALLNDPFFSEQASRWATRLCKQTDQSIPQRIEQMFQAAFGRPATPEEQQRWQAVVQDFANLHQIPAAEVTTSVKVWQDVAHALLNTKEFLYVR